MALVILSKTPTTVQTNGNHSANTTQQSHKKEVFLIRQAKNSPAIQLPAISLLPRDLSLSEWVRCLHKRTEKERNIVIASTVTTSHIDYLTAIGYEDDRRAATEYWFIAGNWQFKVPKSPTFADYYQDAEQMKHFTDHFFLKSRVQEIIQRDRRQFERQIAAMAPKAVLSDDEKADMDVSNLYIIERTRRIDAEKSVRQLENDKSTLEKQIENIRSQVFERFREIHDLILDDKLNSEDKVRSIALKIGAIPSKIDSNNEIPQPEKRGIVHSMKELTSIPVISSLIPSEK